MPPDAREFAPSAKDYREWDDRRFEHEIVQHLFSRYRFPADVRQSLLDESAQQLQVRVLSLELFSNAFPSFPIYLACRKIPKIADNAPVSKLFRDLPGRKFAIELADLRDKRPDLKGVRSLGVVFHWPYLGGHGLVVHDRQVVPAVPGPRLLWYGSHEDEYLVVEPLAVLLNSLEHGSSPRDWFDFAGG